MQHLDNQDAASVVLALAVVAAMMWWSCRRTADRSGGKAEVAESEQSEVPGSHVSVLHRPEIAPRKPAAPAQIVVPPHKLTRLPPTEPRNLTSITVARPDPSHFQTSCSDDNFATLFARTAGLPTARGARKVFPVDAKAPLIRELRLRIDRCRGGESCNMCQLATLEFFQKKKNAGGDAWEIVHPDAIRASGENPPSECAANLLDATASTKWLHIAEDNSMNRGKGPQFWISVKLSKPTRLVAFALTTGNDAPNRDPHEFTLEGRLKGNFGLYTHTIAEASRPRAAPLNSVDALMAFDAGSLDGGAAVLPLQPRDALRRSGIPASEILVCHDMRGGFTEADRFPQRDHGDPRQFSLYHWHLIDVFVYFSHSLVTIPPSVWINTAHRHGVRCLGTFITEWGSGANLCETSFFASDASAVRLADALTTIARAHGFEGWLINIENNCTTDGMVLRILTFLKRLRSNNQEVCWYDSVTHPSGSLSYQNELNPANSIFFESASSIFVNYQWTAGSPRVSSALAKRLGRRPAEVFMGIDVWNRGTYGGGGFKCNVAIRAAFESGCSCAIFAPGWLHEKLGPEEFQKNNEEFWRLVQTCFPQVQKQKSGRPPLISSLPLCSAFSKGSGRQRFVYGQCVDASPGERDQAEGFFNIAYVDVLPLVGLYGDVVKRFGDKTLMKMSFEEAKAGAFDGSHVVSCRGILGGGPPRLVAFPLFTAAVPLQRKPLLVSYTFRRNNDQSEVCICLKLRGQGDGVVGLRGQKRGTLVLRGWKAGQQVMKAHVLDQTSSTCLTMTKDKAFFAPVAQILCGTCADGGDGTDESVGTHQQEDLIARAVALRKEGKSTHAVASILRKERKQHMQRNKKPAPPWQTRQYVIDTKFINRSAVLVGVEVMCTPSRVLNANQSCRDVAFDVDIGEFRISQPRVPILGEDREDARYRFMISGSVQVRRVLWSSPRTICFDVVCQPSDVAHPFQVEEPRHFDMYMKRGDGGTWHWLGRSVGRTFRAMHVSALEGDVVVVGVVPSSLTDRALLVETHRGTEGLHGLLEQSAQARVQL